MFRTLLNLGERGGPTFPTVGFAYYHALDPKLAAKIKEAFYSFKIQGTSLGKDFRDATHFIPIDYRKDWEAVAGLLEANGVVFSRESAWASAPAEPPCRRRSPSRRS